MSNSQKPEVTAITADRKASAQRHYELGRLLWKQGKKAEAITEYNKAVADDPESPAATALQMANNIMDFYDKQRYNP